MQKCAASTGGLKMLRMNKIRLLFLSLIIFIFIGNFNSCANKSEINRAEANRTDGYIPKDGFVPNEETAKKIAEAVLYPIYGETIKNQKPYKVTLIENKIWVVEGTLSKNAVGGVFHIEIQKDNCAILNVSHGK
jgi:hypothetical protein